MQQLRRSALAPDGGELSDGGLLDRFTRQRDEAAFAALVRRHGPMVWGVCRRVLGGHHDAEDAFQATFLVLVRKAGAIARKELLAGWLCGVAYQTARKARALAARRQARETLVADVPEVAATRHDIEADLGPLLDRELSRLPDKYRLPLVLCDLEGKTRREASALLHCPEGTVAGRLARARALLARRLSRRGVTLSGGALAALLARDATASVPAVAAATVKAGVALASGLTPGVSAQTAALTEGVIKTMLLKKIRLVAMVLLVVVGLAAVSTGHLARLTLAGEAADLGELSSATSATPQTAAAPPAKGDQNLPQDGTSSSAEGNGSTPSAKWDKNLMQGTWQVIKIQADGTHLVNELSETQRWVFTWDKITIHYDDGSTDELSYLLDSYKKPKTIDMTLVAGHGHKGTIFLGIYKLEGDLLTIQRAGTERPTKFDIGLEAHGYIQFTLKRVKPGTDTGGVLPPAKGQDLPQGTGQPAKKVPDLSARIAVITKMPVAGTRLEAELILTNESAKPIRLCTLCGGMRSGSSDGAWYEEQMMPDFFKSDAPPLAMSAKHVVTLQPGKSVALPFSLFLIPNAKGQVTIKASYSIGKEFAQKLDLWSGEVKAEPLTLSFAKVEWLDVPKDLKSSKLKVELTPAAKVTHAKGGLLLPMKLVCKSAPPIKVQLTHEWHGGEAPPTDLYASVTPATAAKEEPFRPVYVFGEQDGKATKPLTLEGGTTLSIDLRMDWPGTGSVIVNPLMKAPGAYKVRFLLVFEDEGVRQYVIGPETIVQLPPAAGE
jgi:RNA polymerase sigma factor (sigma-70 family)